MDWNITNYALWQDHFHVDIKSELKLDEFPNELLSHPNYYSISTIIDLKNIII